MSSLALVSALSLWVVQAPLSGPARCLSVCESYLKSDSPNRSVCSRCAVEGGSDRGAWAAALASRPSVPGALLDSILADEDWAVRWGALRATAQRKRLTDVRQLASFVAESPPARTLSACVTAARVAASRGQQLAELLSGAGPYGPSATDVCWRKRAEIQRAVEVDLYAEAADTRSEGLQHLAVFLGVSPAKVIFGAMASRSAESDRIVASALVGLAERGGLPVGALLLQGVEKKDEPFVNRLLQVYSADIDRLRPGLVAATPEARREAIGGLALFAPLSAHELEACLDDGDTSVALAAARGLARGEGKTVVELARQRLAIGGADSHRWLTLVSRAAEPGCDKLLAEVAGDAHRSEEVRAAALAGIGPCVGAKGLPLLDEGLKARSPRMRAAAVAALASMPRASEAEQRAAAALHDASPLVLAAAARVVAEQRQTRRADELEGLLGHGSEEVRAAAVSALGRLSASAKVRSVAQRLRADTASSVRLAAAVALGELGGPIAASALADASRKDRLPEVRTAAKSSLERLGLRP